MTTLIKPVTIPREVADAIDAARNHGVTNAAIIDVRNDEFQPHVPGLNTKVLRLIPFDTLLAALVNGYERELTEEEARHKVVADEYAEYVYGVQQRETEAEDYAYADGIVFTLNALGVKIMGVNTSFTTEGGAA